MYWGAEMHRSGRDQTRLGIMDATDDLAILSGHRETAIVPIKLMSVSGDVNIMHMLSYRSRQR